MARAAHHRFDWGSPWAFVGLVLLVLLAFAPVYGFGWVFDDGRQIVENETIRAWSGLGRGFADTLWSFDESRPGDPRRTYRPLFVVYLTLARHAFGESAGGFHLASLGLHVIASWVVWRLARRLRLAPPAALAAAGLFALHPIQIQAVAWVSAATDPMQMIALGLAAIAWVDALEAKPGGAAAWRGAISAALGLLVGMLCIERAFVFAGVLVVLAGRWPAVPDGPRPGLVQWRRRARLLAPSLVAIVGVALARSAATGEVAATVPSVSWMESVWTGPVLARAYAELSLVPLQTSIAYPIGVLSGPTVDFLVGGVLGIGVLALAVWASRGAALRQSLLAAALIMLAPALVARLLHPQLLVQDRYLYVPMALCAVWLADVVWSSSRAVKLACALWLLALSSMHRSNLRIWTDNLSLYTRGVEVAPGHPTLAMNLSNERRRLGLGDEECALARAALHSMEDERWRGSPMSQHYNLANCWRDVGALERASEHYRAAFEASGETALQPLFNLASLQLDRGDVPGLERSLADLRTHFPEQAATWRLLGIVAARRGELDEAREHFERALALDPADVASRRMLERLPPP